MKEENTIVIDGVRYPLTITRLLCTATIAKPGRIYDPTAKTISLYFLDKNLFLLRTSTDWTQDENEIIDRGQAVEFMRKHPDRIKERAYKKHIGSIRDI